MSAPSPNNDRADNEAQNNKRSQYKTSPLHAAVSGAFAGGLARTIVAPIERIKLLMQLQSSLPQEYMNKNSWQIASNIYLTQGVRAFWKGNWANLWNQAGISGLNFFFMDYYKAVSNWYFPGNHNTSNVILSSLLSGGLAGGTATTVLYPIQFIRTKMAADLGTTNQPWTIIRNTIQSDGIRGIYQGYGISIVGVFVYRSLHLGGYDAIKTVYLDKDNGKEDDGAAPISWMYRFMVAQFVSLVAGTICYPIDSVRRRLMMQVGGERPKLFRNAWHAFQIIFVKEGIRGFYLGLGPNLVRSIGNALVLVTYDAVKNILP
eukprot:CAMPEP_0178928642 /NCGR_PEP_ID=MMETSP0786-20121207/20039_1 /TAXON_ID=186022 /ORGANISM="Thalassionema frauenfeldii, Strain CCMP 1798" /LENGTH=317 /DNA_ID=CAMNT_0020604573 /DNA_START=210 /DNA_END=1163 /DNA_ORIENTATION=-